MVYRWFLQHWLRSAAQEKLRETVIEAAQEKLAEARKATEEHRPCDVGLVFALSNESGGLEDLLAGVVTTRGEGFVARHGLWRQRHVVLVLSGAGRAAAARATDALILGHRPGWVISAGFCGGLSPEVKRHDIVVASSSADAAGNVVELDAGKLAPVLAAWKSGVHVGRLLTVDQIVRRPDQKRSLGEKHQAIAADLESLGVAEVCRRQGVPFLAIRVVSDAVDDELPREVERLTRQKTRAARWGAAFGAILNRPGSLKDMYRLRENALVASDRLARFLAATIEHLAPLPPAMVE